MAKKPEMAEGVLARDPLRSLLGRTIAFFPNVPLHAVRVGAAGYFEAGERAPGNLECEGVWTPKEWADTYDLKPPAPRPRQEVPGRTGAVR